MRCWALVMQQVEACVYCAVSQLLIQLARGRTLVRILMVGRHRKKFYTWGTQARHNAVNRVANPLEIQIG